MTVGAVSARSPEDEARMYLAHYGLTEEPFSITPDPDFLFLGRQYQEGFFSLVHGIQSRKGFMEITGAVGSGKTTLYRAVLRHLGPTIRAALVINPTLSAFQLLQTIVEDFEIEVQSKTKKDYFDALNRFLLDTVAHGSTAVVIMDEAQDLHPGALEQIRLLSNFETDKAKLLQIILVGQPELLDMLARPSLSQIRQRIAVSVDLAPLDREEMEQYIAHRIRVAGGNGMLIFDPPALEEIHRYSKGIPRLINVLCDKALLMAYMHSTGQTAISYLEKSRPASPLPSTT
jgi:general secretion pathway protein A